MMQDAEKIFNKVVELAPRIRSQLKGKSSQIGEQNPSDESVIEADVWVDQKIRETLLSLEEVGEYVSEEMEEPVSNGEGLSVAVDPVDGSSNLETNNTVGTIVGVYNDDLPAKGEELELAFYILYGPKTTVVKADGSEVTEFVVDEETGTLEKTQEVEIPEDPKVYGLGGNLEWTQNFKLYANEVRNNLKLRYGGSFVGDFNQVLLKGGIFAYPENKKYENGKLRLQFEANPMAFIMESAGGSSSDGSNSILQQEPEEVHSRTPVYLGNEDLVEEAKFRS